MCVLEIKHYEITESGKPKVVGLSDPMLRTMNKKMNCESCSESSSESETQSSMIGLESVEARLLVYQQNETVFEEDIKLLKLENVHSFVQSTEHVKSLRSSVQHVETFIPAANPKTTLPKPKSMETTRIERHALCHYAKMTLLNPQKHVVPTVVLTKSKLVPITAARLVTAAVLKSHVIRARPTKPIVTKPYSPPRRHINRSLSPKASNFPPKVTAVKVP
nr:DNA-directed RNA polymerase II subunit 1 [Tanacetum cinerariifolium]